MKFSLVHSKSSLAVLGCASVLGFSNVALACPAEPYISAVCIMAVPWTNLDGYLPADGRQLTVNSQQALFSLVGYTYGGSNSVFNIPDLRGRVVVGAGAGTFPVAQKGGAINVTLTAAQVPLIPHAHAVSTVSVATGIGSLAANTTLSGLSATTSMSGVTATAAGSGLSLNASTNTLTTGTPGGSALGNGGFTKTYTTGTPSVAMAAGSIGGSAAVTFTGNPTTTVTGTPATTLSGAPSVTLAGSTTIVGMAPTATVPTMMPYLAMNYFIAVTGLYPSRN